MNDRERDEALHWSTLWIVVALVLLAIVATWLLI